MYRSYRNSNLLSDLRRLSEAQETPRPAKIPKSLSDLRKLPASQSTISAEPSGNSIPRGLQIPAKDTATLLTGFDYPPCLDQFNVTKRDWEQCWFDVTRCLATASRIISIPHRIEAMLDEIARWDKEYFRPRSLLMRWDMPGEQKYGLDFMDLWYEKEIYNFADIGTRMREAQGQLKLKKQRKWKLSLHDLRNYLFESTRMVLDHIDVLEDPEKAKRNGWTLWNQACEIAAAASVDPDIEKRVREIRLNNLPWDFNELVRKQRWPPSKQLYYDRYRCTSLNTFSFIIYMPDPDSMDQRISVAITESGNGSMFKQRGTESTSLDAPRLTVLPADHVPFMRITQTAITNLPTAKQS